MGNYHIPLQPSCYYHLFNRAVGNEKLFPSESNYYYFLRKAGEYLLPVADIYAYALLPNHFHLLIRTKEDQPIADFYQYKTKKEFNAGKIGLHEIIMQQFSNWLNAYTKAFNKMYNRKGSLFIDYIKRSRATDDHDLSAFIFYIQKMQCIMACANILAIGNTTALKASFLKNLPYWQEKKCLTGLAERICI